MRSACQQLVCAALDGDPTCIADVVEALHRDVPETEGPTEVLLLRESLDLHLGHLVRTLHQRFHARFAAAACADPFLVVAVPWAGTGARMHDALDRWQAEFTTRFERYHALPPALQAKRILQQELAHPLTLRVLSERVGASRTALSTQFIAMFGETPASQLARLRTRRALLRLWESGESLADIAPSVGYQSAAKLHRRVCSYTGITPAEVRRLSARELKDLLADKLRAVAPPEYAGAQPPAVDQAADRRRMERRSFERRARPATR